MRRERRVLGTLVCLMIALFFMVSLALESPAWARAGGGGSSGSRGGRSFSSPSMPPTMTPRSSPGMTPGFGAPGGMGYGRSPFWSGLAGGVVGGFIGNMLFGGRAYGGSMGYGGGPGLLDLLIIGGLIYFGYRYFIRRRGGQSIYYEETRADEYGAPYYAGQGPLPVPNDVERGLEEIRRFDPSFSTEKFQETAEDLFFRIQAAWMNRNLEGIENLVTPEMRDYFTAEFTRMKHDHVINRLENIAVRKVEPAEVWQESGRDFITVLFTANLLDYTVDDKSEKLKDGDKLNPVKFQEFWTFTRDVGSRGWQLAGINQLNEPSPNL